MRQVPGAPTCAIAGEVVRIVPPLAAPSDDAPPVPGEIEQYDAVQLFLDRVRLQQPDFALTEATAPLVARLCRRLDGLPLAIEIAATRLPSLPLRRLVGGPAGDRARLVLGPARGVHEGGLLVEDLLAAGASGAAVLDARLRALAGTLAYHQTAYARAMDRYQDAG